MTEYVRLGDVCDISAGQGAPQGDDMYCKQGGKPFIKAGNLEWLSSGGSLNAIQQVNDKTVKSHKLRLYSKGSVVFAKSGMSCKKSFVYVLEENCYIVSHLACLTPKKIESDFLKYYLQAHPPSELIKNESYPSIKLSDISDILIPPLPLEEQKRIAAALDTMYSVIAKRKQLIALLDEAAKSLFVEMFGDPVENPMGWVVKQINSFSTVKIGPFGSALHQHDYIVGGHPLINPKHISNGTIYPDLEITVDDEKYHILDAYALSRGDVIVGRRGDIGRCAVVNEDGYICGTGSLFIRILDSCNSIYLKSVIEHPKMRKRLEDSSVGVTMKNLNAKIVSSFNIPLPPLDLQNLFAARIEALEAQRASCERGLKQMETAFAAMMQEYFG